MSLDSLPSASKLGHHGRARVELLGGFNVWDGERSVNLPTSAARVVVYLALRDRPTPRNSLAGTLWPETTEERANASLRSSIWRARKAIPDLVVVERSTVTLAQEAEIDARVLDRIARDVLAGEPPHDLLVLAKEHLGSELLPGWYEDWVLVERERIRLLTLRAIERASDWLRGHGNTAGAVEIALLAIGLEPLRESGHRSLVSAHLAYGNVWEAVQAYHTYARLLHQELGIEPTIGMAQLLTDRGINLDRVAV